MICRDVTLCHGTPKARYYRVLTGTTGYYRVLTGTTGYYRVLPDVTISGQSPESPSISSGLY
eukprot:78458-Amorphochlora_amoeboformis.AAC.1